MRTDCTRDNVGVKLPRASLLGMGKPVAKRGDWVRFALWLGASEDTCGRVVGRVTCEGIHYVEVVALLGMHDSPTIRWILPELVAECVTSPPRRIWQFMASDWNAPDVLARVEHGFLSDSYLDTYGTDLWHYVGVCVQEVEGEDNQATGPVQSVWGIESDAGDYLRTTALELAEELVPEPAAFGPEWIDNGDGSGVWSDGEEEVQSLMEREALALVRELAAIDRGRTDNELAGMLVKIIQQAREIVG